MGGWSTKGVTCRVKPKVESFTGIMAHKRWNNGPQEVEPRQT